MLRRTAGIIAAAWVLSGGVEAATIYVSSTSGTPSGPGTYEAPYATIDQARAAIAGSAAGYKVEIAPGDYPLTSTLAFGPSDSGSLGNPVTYHAMQGIGSVRILGGTAVTGWTLHSGSIYKATVTTPVYTVYENGRRARMAREPNYVRDKFFPAAWAPYFRATGPNLAYTQLTYSTSDLNDAAVTNWNFNTVSLVAWSGGTWNWFTDTTPILGKAGSPLFTLTLAHEVRHYVFQGGTGSRYFVQGDLTMLDQAGEWYRDPATNTLYMWCTDGICPSQDVVIPTLQKVVSIAGADATTRVHDITLDGLTVQYSDFLQWYRYAEWGVVSAGENPTAGAGHTWPIYSHEASLTGMRYGAIYIANADRITVQNTEVLNSGFHGIYLEGYNQAHTFTNNWIHDVGASALHIEGNYPAEGDTSKNNTITNCLHNNYGQLVGHGAGVYLADSGSNTVMHCEFFGAPRSAVHITGWTTITPTDIYARSNQLRFLRIHDVNEDSGDSGALDTVFLSSLDAATTANKVINTANQITVDASISHPSMTDFAPRCVMFDNETSHQITTSVACMTIQGLVEIRNPDNANVQEQSNVSWAAGYNDDLINYSAMGPTSTFPFLGAPNLYEGFELYPAGVAKRWTAGRGSRVISSARAHSGSWSWKTTADRAYLYVTLPQRLNKVVTLWFYDAGGGSESDFARVDLGSPSDLTTMRALGVDTATDATHYVYQVDSTKTATSVSRTTGWHELKWDYTTGTKVDLYVDGTLVASPAGVVQFTTIAFGDFAADGVFATAYFDDVNVLEFSDGLENGTGNWTAGIGTVATSTTQAKDGTRSVVQSENGDVAWVKIENRHYKKASIWFYDDAADTTLEAMARVDEATYAAGSFTTYNNTAWRAIGVNTATSTTAYVVRVGATTYATGIARTTGWHQFQWDYTSGAGPVLSIDGVAVFTARGAGSVRQFDIIAFGDFTAADGNAGTVYWDKVEVGL